MISSALNDNPGFNHLCQRLLHQDGGAFYCVTVKASLPHTDIAQTLCKRFDKDSVQVMDFSEYGDDLRFSSDFIKKSINAGASIVLLCNFHMAVRGMPEAEFFQILNLSRDVLAELPVVFVFMMPFYFRVNIARNAPDFDSFFTYRVDFGSNDDDIDDLRIEFFFPREHSQADKVLLKYYESQWKKIEDFNSRHAFDTLAMILFCNIHTQSLSAKRAERYFSLFEKLLSQYKDETELSLSDIAQIFESRFNYSKALELYKDAIAECILKWGQNHPFTGELYNNIGNVFDKAGAYSEALEWFMKALPISESLSDKEPQFAATTYNNIALAYSKQGNYQEALQWYKKALTINEDVYGPQHLTTAMNYSNIAAAYAYDGNYTQAINLNERALSIRKNELGEEHPLIAMSYNNIAFVYGKQGDYYKALSMHLKALAIYEKTLGKAHPDTGLTYNNIAFIYLLQGKNEEALSWFIRSYKVLKNSVGEDVLDSMRVMNNMESAYHNAGMKGDFNKWLSRQLKR